jgi:copper chaperone
MKTEFQVEGMSCQHCVAAVTNAIREHDDGAQVQVDLAAGRVAVESTQSVEALKAAIDEAGYTVKGAVKGEVKGVSPDAASGAAGGAAH